MTAQILPNNTQASNMIYNIMHNVGCVKYLVNFHDGVKAHKDGSQFFDIRTFKSMKKLNAFIKSLKKLGYQQQSFC